AHPAFAAAQCSRIPDPGRRWPGPPARAAGAHAGGTGSGWISWSGPRRRRRRPSGGCAQWMSSWFLLAVVVGAARPLLMTGRREPPPLIVSRDWLTTDNVRSAVSWVCFRADTASAVWPTQRSGSSSLQARRSSDSVGERFLVGSAGS